MPLLRSLVPWKGAYYKHGAPYGACAAVAHAKLVADPSNGMLTTEWRLALPDCSLPCGAIQSTSLALARQVGPQGSECPRVLTMMRWWLGPDRTDSQRVSGWHRKVARSWCWKRMIQWGVEFARRN